MTQPVEDQRFKTMRHIEAVRNHVGACVAELLDRAVMHDQTKLEDPERSGFDEYTAKLRGTTYNSPEYKQFLAELQPVLDHHYKHKFNRHHPEHHREGIRGMNLIDVLEMLCDWKAATMRHADGDILKSIEINQDRFDFSDDLSDILINTACWLDEQKVYHRADQS
jgi:Family of unknown function (DUF5662)